MSRERQVILLGQISRKKKPKYQRPTDTFQSRAATPLCSQQSGFRIKT